MKREWRETPLAIITGTDWFVRKWPCEERLRGGPVTYDIGNSGQGICECPKCSYTMEPLRKSTFLNRNEGYLLDNGIGWDPDDNATTSFLLGSPTRFLWRHFVEPISNKLFGEWRNRQRRRILRSYHGSLICPHCQYILKRP